MASSLADILQDPNYVNANDATKKAIFDKFSAQDTNYTGANEATQKAIRVKFGVEPPAAAAPSEGMPGARAPAWSKDYPGLYSAAVTARQTLGPALEAAGATVGGILGTGAGPVGTVAGAGLGYGAARQGLRAADVALGLEQPAPTVGQAALQAGKDVATGAGYEMGGALASKALGGVATAAQRAFGESTAPTVQQLKSAETKAWDTVKQSTAAFDNPTPLQNSVSDLLSPAKYNYAPETFPAVKPVVAKLDKLYETAANGEPISIHDMRTVRTMLQDVENSNAKPAEKSLANSIKNELDSYVMTHGGDSGTAWADARSISNQLFRSRDIQSKLEDASSKEIRSKFADLMDSNAIRAYTPEQQQLIQQIAKGSLTQKGLELITDKAPQSIGWGKIAALLGVTHYGGPTAGAILGTTMYGAGAAASAAANALARSKANALDELIRGGRLAPPVNLNFLQAPATAGAILATQPSQNALAR